MLDFSSVIIGYMAKKNLRLTLSDFIWFLYFLYYLFDVDE
jgi:hypothetical protein